MKNRPLFVFDIDETLVHTFESKSGFNQAEKGAPYEVYSLEFDDDFYWGFIRPFARDLIQLCDKVGRVAFWSAGQDDYVNAIVPKILNTTDVKPVFIWHREYCKTLPDKWYSVKEFNMKKPLENIMSAIEVGEIKPKEPVSFQDIVIIDDRDDVCSQNPSHHFFIEAFKPDKKSKEAKDSELKKLMEHIQDGVKKRKHILEISSTYNA